MGHGSLADADDVDVAVQRDPARARAGQRDAEPEQLVARRLLARMVRVGAQRGEVVLVQLGVEPERGGQLAEPLERRAARRP